METAGAVVVGHEVQNREVDRATLIGSGKAQELENLRLSLGFDFLVFDEELSPLQQRNLERIIGCQVLDRTAVILDIFAQRAQTREAKLQVELAQLTYRLPRLTGKGIEYSRQGGGSGTVFNRGPGETKLEVDRRRIRQRMARLKLELEEVRAHRERMRTERADRAIPVVALTGYTNAGKSTLHRKLTGSDVLAEDQLFATLDATTRKVLPSEGEPYLLVDTVGFIQKLPHQLVAAFRSTLEEVNQADLLLHVVDASHPKCLEQMQTVHEVLRELGAADKPMLLVFNKIDLVDDEQLKFLMSHAQNSIAIAASEGIQLQELQQSIQDMLQNRRQVVEVVIPYARSSWLAWVHEHGHVLAEEHLPDGTLVRASLEKGLANRLKAALEAY